MMKAAMKNFGVILAGGAVALFLTGFMVWKSDWDLPPVQASQNGFRGTAMEQVRGVERQAALLARNVPPAVPYEAAADGPRAREAHPTLQLLGDLSEEQLTRLMVVMTEWVAPKEGDDSGCAYCHNTENMADRSKYTHQVSARMIQMTRTINSEWRSHVADTGVTCYTCHRGQPVPANIWFRQPDPNRGSQWVGWSNSQNIVGRNVGLTSLPTNALEDFLLRDRNIRVHTLSPYPQPRTPTRASIQDTEWTYGLMVHMSESLGVNCTYCHNSRAFNVWEEGPAARVTAWHGIRMSRALNVTYLEPLGPVYPPNRLGPTGDAPKVGCATCHGGLNRPLNGAQMLRDYVTELGGPRR
jgi:photosynthetic reaction center cytochrome c subunit